MEELLKCPSCNGTNLHKSGLYRKTVQRYECKDCEKVFTPGLAPKGKLEPYISKIKLMRQHNYSLAHIQKYLLDKYQIEASREGIRLASK
jgi:transposase-like protein